MTHRVDIYGKRKMVALAARLLLMLTLVLSFSCSSDEEQGTGDAWVTLSISTGNADDTATRTVSSDGNGSVMEGVADQNDKDWYVSDITVYVFNQAGDVIGSDYASYSIKSKTTITAKVKTRKAQNCTVIAVANAGTLNSNSAPFAGVSTLAEFKKQFLTFKDITAQQNAKCLLMMGTLTSFDTTKGEAEITLQRLASKFTYNITVNQDKDISLPIVVDSYQLCSVPMSAYYVQDDMASPTLPSGTIFGDYPAVSTPINSWATSPTATYENYMYANSQSTESQATYLLINAHSQVSNTDAHKIWQSQFKVYLDAYKVLPNYHYTVDVTVQGSIQSTKGVIVSYKAYPYFGNITLEGWGTVENRNLDLK